MPENVCQTIELRGCIADAPSLFFIVATPKIGYLILRNFLVNSKVKPIAKKILLLVAKSASKFDFSLANSYLCTDVDYK